jgi:hypothetical protein
MTPRTIDVYVPEDQPLSNEQVLLWDVFKCAVRAAAHGWDPATIVAVAREAAEEIAARDRRERYEALKRMNAESRRAGRKR